MAVLNATPDSFSDGGHFFSLEKAKIRIQAILNEGADIIDVGGESSRPGAASVSLDEELSRVLPVISAIREQSDCLISIDTTKPSVMRAAVNAGAGLINDICALDTPEALEVAASLEVPVCLMHKKGIPQTMQSRPHYPYGVVQEVKTFFQNSIERCLKAGIAKTKLILDPGFGFGKNDADNLTLLKNMAELTKVQIPMLLGASRKHTLGAITGTNVSRRSPAGLAIAAYAIDKGAAIIRSHDVWQTKQAITMMQAIKQTNEYDMERA